MASPYDSLDEEEEPARATPGTLDDGEEEH